MFRNYDPARPSSDQRVGFRERTDFGEGKALGLGSVLQSVRKWKRPNVVAYFHRVACFNTAFR
jgi:hypothetical protein